jgi:FkbM family methyltransferase
MILSAMFARAIFYSHEREREIVGDFLGAEPGFFVDVGANDPKEGSQSWHLEQHGWTGVLVEPQPELADKLRRQRNAKVYGVACSSSANAGTTMTLYRAGIQSSVNPEFWVYKMQRDGTVEVPVRTLDDILTDAEAPAPLDD